MAKSQLPKALSGGCLTLFGLPFLAAGLFISWIYFSGYTKWWSAQRWEEVPCWIESTDLKIDTGGDSDSYKTTATYRYIYRGRAYHGDKVAFTSGGREYEQNLHAELSQYAGEKPSRAERDSSRENGRAFRCYVNPEKPAEAVLYRNLRWQIQAFVAIFALTFPAIGAGLVFGGFWGIGRLRREAALRERHPAEPWKWKPEWAGDSISESPASWKPVLYLYTLWSGLVIAPLILTTAMTGAFQTGSSAWLLTIFVALWAIPVSLCIKFLRQRMAVGAARFEMKETPAWPGGVLSGAVVLEKTLPLRATADVGLACYKKVTRGSGEDKSTTTEKIWSHHETVPQDMVTRDPSGFRLPVSFTLPADAPESGETADPSTEHRWEIGLKVPGTPISTIFEVPVFRTAQSPALAASQPLAAPSILDEAAADLPALLAARRIKAEFDSAGLPVSIICPPARQLGMIAFLIIFDLIWTAVAVFLIHQHAPLIFRIVWPVSAAVIWLIVLWNILHKRTVGFNASGLEVRNQLGPIIWTQAFEKSQITGFSHDTNMTSNNTSFYRVRLESVLGKKKTLADSITESTTAAALVKRLEAWKK